MMRVLLPLMACLCAALPTPAVARQVTLPLPVGARVQVAPLIDGYTVGLFVRGTDAAALRKRLKAFEPKTIEVLTPPGKMAVAYMHFEDRVTLATASHAKEHGPGGIALTIETVGAREAVLAHALKAALPLPASLESDELREADHKLLEGHIAQAQMLLDRLKGGYALHAWVLLRMGDVALHYQDIDGACQHYADANHEGLERTASVMAALRARVLGCSTKHAPPWGKLLSRDALDDPVGQRIADEAAWALSHERDVAALREVIELQGRFYDRTIGRELRQSLVARLLRLERPLGVVAFAEHPSKLAGHPEAFDLDLGIGRAWCALGSVQSWRQRSAQAQSFMTLTPKERRAWQTQAASCELSPATVPSAQAKKDNALPQVDVEKHLHALARRVEAAERAVTARLRKSKPHSPKPPPPPGDGAQPAATDGAASPEKEQG